MVNLYKNIYTCKNLKLGRHVLVLFNISHKIVQHFSLYQFTEII
jgi:hypothetical protein